MTYRLRTLKREKARYHIPDLNPNPDASPGSNRELMSLSSHSLGKCSVVTRGWRAAQGDTIQGVVRGGDTLMKIGIFLRLNLQEHWTNDHLERWRGCEW